MPPIPVQLPNVPRYTSYPTAPNFTRNSAKSAQRKLYSSITPGKPVSVYIHIPFCDRLCWFCGCHTKHTLKYEPIASYVETLVEEIRQFAAKIPFRPSLANLHFGGGSPSILKSNEAKKIRNAIEAAFEILPRAEISIEVDPNDASAEMYDALQILGMTRISLGVQDFNPQVQQAINRPQSFEDTEKLILTLRHLGIQSLNIDALYGLPFQTTETIVKTAKQVLSLEPDRIALFGYAHVPWMKKHQKLIDEKSLPDNEERISQAQSARDIFSEAGYDPIGLDHFAKQDDPLAKASRASQLRRNFQGYTTDSADTLIGFGASSISSNKETYVQNTVATGNYKQLVSENLSVAERGLILCEDDQIRAFMIQSLMCNFRLDTQALILEFGDAAYSYKEEVETLFKSELVDLCSFDNGVLKLHPESREYVRVIASKFDAYINLGNSSFSKAV